MIGRVAEFDPVLRYGRIVGEDSVDYFVHVDDVEGVRVVQGCRVEFTPGWARRRPRALEVRRLDDLAVYEAAPPRQPR